MSRTARQHGTSLERFSAAVARWTGSATAYSIEEAEARHESKRGR